MKPFYHHTPGHEPYDSAVFRGLLMAMPLHAVEAMKRIVLDAQRYNARLDVMMVARAMRASCVAMHHADREPIPADLAGAAANSGGREYELSIHHTADDGMQQVRRQYIAECRQVADLVDGGMPMDRAWQRVRLGLGTKHERIRTTRRRRHARM